MSEQRNDGGPAFPHPDYLYAGPDGMTLRDYFAAKAMNGALLMIAAGQHQPRPGQQSGPSFVAATAYEVADAMLKAREA